MSASLENLTDLCSRVLSSVKFWSLHVGTRTWKRLRPIVLQVLAWIVSIYRLRLRSVVFIGVTGSCGKTTTKEMVAAVLSSQYEGHKNRGNNNILGEVMRSILLTGRGYKFCIQEFNVGGIGEAIPIEKQFKMFKPQIGVVTTVGDDHISALGSREAIAAEKGKLIAALPKHGIAILNADDHLVLAMQSRCKGRVVTYGLSPDAMVRAEDIRDDWPNRLSLTVLHEGESVRVQTQFCGAHLVPNVLATMAVGQALGVSLQSAAAVLEGLAPVPGRMCPTESPDGVMFISDDVKAPVWAIPAALDFMRRATAKRKIVILGTLSDYQGGAASSTYARVARQALEVADYVFFVGPWASRALRAKRHLEDEALRAFVTIDHINGFLHGFLQPGDLVLLKGSQPDRLSRIMSTWMEKPKDLEDSITPKIASSTPRI
jgi:UDP-N-acetylmuramoyl-tripeptide--D-alanyl-D-alanine ligase